MKFKKFLALSAALLLGASTAVFAACTGGEEEGDDPNNGGGTVVKDQPVTVTEEGDTVKMENGNLSLTVNKQNGSVTDIAYLGTDTHLVHGDGANFSLTVDPTTNDVFKANHAGKDTLLLQSGNFTPTFNAVKSDAKGQIELSYDLSFSKGGTEVSGIKVKNTLTLERNSLSFTSDYEITNQAASDCVVVSFTGMQVSGIKDENANNAWSLYYPYWEGKIYEKAVSMIDDGTAVGTKLTAGYPTPITAQLMQVFNKNTSFDYSVLDANATYKEFCFGQFTDKLEYDAGRAEANNTSMACTQFPFVKTGATEKVSTVRIGAGGEGNWYEGADRYRDFLISSGMLRAKNNLNSEWSGMTAMQAQNNQGAMFLPYNGYAGWLTQTEGMHTICALGWYENGFDHMYPDYEFSTVQGGSEGFAKMTAGLKAQGNSIICDMNMHIADEESVWASEPSKSNSNLTKIQAAAIKKIGFEYGVTAPEDYEDYMYFENYSGLSAVAMSPASEDFQDAVVAAATRLAEGGANGIWYGQLMERPSCMDYDSSHGAKNPATAYGEGYNRVLGAIADIFDKSTNGNSIFAGEGLCDAYGKYVDVCGMKWSRRLGTTDTDGAELDIALMRYLLPSKILGIEGVGTTRGSQNEFCRAFVLGSPFLCSNYQPSLPGHIDIYNSASVLYYGGRFMADRGVRIGNENILAGVFLGSDGTIGLNVYNDSRDKAENARVVITPEALGLEGKKVSKVVNLVTGEFVNVSGENAFAISVNAFLYGAYQIILE